MYDASQEQGGRPHRRHVVALEFCINGEFHEAQFSLADRGDFNYPALLGRRFMSGRLLLDPSDSFLSETDCHYSPLEDIVQ